MKIINNICILVSLIYSKLKYTKFNLIKINNKNQEVSNVNILFAPIFGLADMPLAFERLLASAIKARHRANIFSMGCGRFLDACMWDSESYLASTNKGLVRSISRRRRCWECTSKINISANKTGIKFIKIADFQKINRKMGK